MDLSLSLLVDEETSAAGMATAVDGELLASLLDIAILRYFFYEPDSFFDVALITEKGFHPGLPFEARALKSELRVQRADTTNVYCHFHVCGGNTDSVL